MILSPVLGVSWSFSLKPWCGHTALALTVMPEQGRGPGASSLPVLVLSLFSLSPFLCSRAAISRDPFYEMLAARKKKVSSTKRH